jgi:hypothetical protein
MQVANFFSEDTSFKKICRSLAVHVEKQIARHPRHDARSPLEGAFQARPASFVLLRPLVCY